LIIAVGNSRKDKVWKNIEITWEEFLKRVKNTRRTAETVAEFRNFPKNKQDELKDVGGFVGGKLKEGRRKNGYVEYRSMLTLDMDTPIRIFGKHSPYCLTSHAAFIQHENIRLKNQDCGL